MHAKTIPWENSIPVFEAELNGASPILRFEAISGRPLFCRDLEARAGFASLIAREYEESMALYARGLAARKAALARDEEA